MKNPKRSSLTRAIVAGLALGAGSVCASPETQSNDSVTIYSRMQPGAVAPETYRPTAGRHYGGQVPGYAIVRHDRPYDLERGVQVLRVSDVAALIDPTTVTFASLDDPRTRVLEQSFQFDLVSQARLLERYLGETVTVELPRGDNVDLVEGTLLGAGDGLTLQLADGSVRAIRSYSNIHFSQLPGGLITKPTLEWLLDSPKSGRQQTRIAYETQGMTWWADYNVIYDESRGCSMDLAGWVSIINQSGASFENAKLKLIAGDVIDDMYEGVQALIDAGKVNPDRVCAFGGSYGGYGTAQSLVRHNDFYKCGVVIAGVFDFKVMMKLTDIAATAEVAHRHGALLVLDTLGEPDQPFRVLQGNPGNHTYVDCALLRALHNR